MIAALDAAWEAYRPRAAEHDTTPCRLAFDAGWVAGATAERDRIRQLVDKRIAWYIPNEYVAGVRDYFFSDPLRDPS